MNIIQCPNCKKSLNQNGKVMTCDIGHSFDIAKGGYTNLILPHQKKKLNSGDNRLMIDAREAFLLRGYYDFLIDGIESEINLILKADDSDIKTLLDLGCGSGYYTRKLLDDDPLIKKYGIDISKIGIASAAKKDKKSSYIVGSSFSIPILNDSIDIIANIFAPCDLSEIIRILKPGGLFIKVIPIDNHMAEVAKLVYDTFISHKSNITDDIASTNRFTLVNIEELIREVSVEGDDLHNLIKMTPYYYKFSEDQIAQLNNMSVTLSFQIIISQLK